MQKTLKKYWVILSTKQLFETLFRGVFGICLLSSSVAHSTGVLCQPVKPEDAFFTAPSKSQPFAKMSRREFSPSKGDDSAPLLILQGTELNIVVNSRCLAAQIKNGVRPDWLTEEVTGVHGMRKLGAGWQSRSFSWVTDHDWDFDALQSKFNDDRCVKLVSPEARFFVQSAGRDALAQTMVRGQEHLRQLHYFEAMPEFLLPMLTRPKIVIAIIDTGVDFSHPDLRLNRWRNKDEIPSNGIDDEGNGYVDDFDGYNFASGDGNSGPEAEGLQNNHGTHVAGLAAARGDTSNGGSGIDSVAKIMSLNVFGHNGFSRSSSLENAIRYAADQHADVINISLGGHEYSRTMRAALEYAISRGSFIVSASGNDGLELCENPESSSFVSPAIYGHLLNGMIVTGSVDTQNGNYSSFANFGSRFVEIAAPGAVVSDSRAPTIGLLSTFPGGAYGSLSGTSMSAPIVSGSAALVITWLKAYQYTATPARVKQILKESAVSEASLFNYVEGGRTLDLQTVVTYLKENYPPTH